MAHEHRRGLLIILSSPSGAGKSTLARLLTGADDKIEFSISATTRPPRPGEIDGEHYLFRSEAAFVEMVAQGEMLEHATVFGHLYGSPLGPVQTATAEGRDVIFDVDWQGGDQIRASSLTESVVSIFILPPSLTELKRRLISRGQDAPEIVARRMAQARAEISHWKSYDYVLVNDDLERCEADLRTIISAERLKRTRQPFLDTIVSGYGEEEI
ncbi:MAG: guanylate kinase [Pseudomonadota bacterium]